MSLLSAFLSFTCISLHTKNSFIHLVHKANYKYDEIQSFSGKKIAQHALGFLV